jgi:hypothetical protein
MLVNKYPGEAERKVGRIADLLQLKQNPGRPLLGAPEANWIW